MIARDERGLTLVELVISMGMFSFVLLAIMLFMSSGAKSYGHAKSELTLQMESQTTINQITNFIYECNNAEVVTNPHGGDALILYDMERGKPSTNAAVIVNEVNKKYLIYQIGTKLYYQEMEKDAIISDASFVAKDDYLLSQYLNENPTVGFVPSFDKKAANKAVRIKMAYKSGRSTYILSDTHNGSSTNTNGLTIAFRNGYLAK